MNIVIVVVLQILIINKLFVINVNKDIHNKKIRNVFVNNLFMVNNV